MPPIWAGWMNLVVSKSFGSFALNGAPADFVRVNRDCIIYGSTLKANRSPMPIYEYTCQACNKKFDHLARTMTSTDGQDKVPCPECGSKKTDRAMSVFAVGAEGSRSASNDAL